MEYSRVICSNCGRQYPIDGCPYCCPKCGGIYDYADHLFFDPTKIDHRQPGIWKYRHTFNLPEEMEIISLHEGNTPLLWIEAFGRAVAVKCEQKNPTGSFKDRGSSLITSFLKHRRVDSCLEDSSGNAGVSLAAYTAKAGMGLDIYIPDSTSPSKKKHMELYGAKLTLIKGNRSAVAEETRKMAEKGLVYASHAYLPFNLPGYATIAFEIFEQMGNKAPRSIIVPIGQGGLLLGLARGFNAILRAGLITYEPKLIGVQARSCAPLWALFHGGVDGLKFATEGYSRAEGVRIWRPVRGDFVLSAIGSHKGNIIAVDEEDIQTGVDEFSLRGQIIEPTSALVWSALVQCVDDCDDPIVIILTGNGE